MAKELKETYLFEMCEKDVSQIRTKEGATGFPGLYEMLSRCVAMYPDKEGKLIPQTIRYISGETTVVAADQRKDITKRNEKPIRWIDGKVLVSKFEPMKLEFLLNHPLYEGNENRDKSKPAFFKEIDKNQIKIKELKNAKIGIEAEALVVDMFKNNAKGAISFCEAVGVKTDQDADLMEHDLLVRVRKNPELFLKQLQDPTLKNKAFVQRAIKGGVISIKGNSVTWGDGSPTGFTCPIGVDTQEAFINWFEDKVGKKVLEQIKFRLENPIEQAK